jgi:hypothetical protein
VVAAVVMVVVERLLHGFLVELLVAGGAGALVYLLLAFTPQTRSAALGWATGYLDTRRAART